MSNYTCLNCGQTIPYKKQRGSYKYCSQTCCRTYNKNHSDRTLKRPGQREKYLAKLAQLAEKLKTHTQTTGKPLKQADVLTLTGRSATDLYAQLEKYDIDAPPLWDSKTEKARRRSDALMHEAKKRDQDWLTWQEARDIFQNQFGLRIYKRNDILATVQSIIKLGFPTPKIRYKRKPVEKPQKDTRQRPVEKVAHLDHVMATLPPAGLSVRPVRREGDRIVYEVL